MVGLDQGKLDKLSASRSTCATISENYFYANRNTNAKQSQRQRDRGSRASFKRDPKIRGWRKWRSLGLLCLRLNLGNHMRSSNKMIAQNVRRVVDLFLGHRYLEESPSSAVHANACKPACVCTQWFMQARHANERTSMEADTLLASSFRMPRTSQPKAGEELSCSIQRRACIIREA